MIETETIVPLATSIALRAVVDVMRMRIGSAVNHVGMDVPSIKRIGFSGEMGWDIESYG